MFNPTTPKLSFPSLTSASIGPAFGPAVPTLTIPTTTVATTPSIQHGLGGPINENAGKDVSAKTGKESSTLPPEMMPLVESLKKFIKDQKQIREENSQQRFSIQPILEVEKELEDNLKVNLHKIDLELQRNSKSIESVKRETNQLLSNAEMALRISRIDIPSTSTSYSVAQNQYVNACMHQYFVEMISNFEDQMNKYSKQIQDLQLHLDNMNKPYNTDELFQIMRKQHETLISLAAQVYAVHEEINKIKQQNEAVQLNK